MPDGIESAYVFQTIEFWQPITLDSVVVAIPSTGANIYSLPEEKVTSTDEALLTLDEHNECAEKFNLGEGVIPVHHP